MSSAENLNFKHWKYFSKRNAGFMKLSEKSRGGLKNSAWFKDSWEKIVKKQRSKKTEGERSETNLWLSK